MNNLNSVLIEGNVVRDALLRSTPKGTEVCNFSIACNRYYRQDGDFVQETGFFYVECWGRLARPSCEKAEKGRGVRVVGRLKHDRWLGTDEKHHSRVVIVAEHVEFRPEAKKNGSRADSLADEAAGAMMEMEEEVEKEEALAF